MSFIMTMQLIACMITNNLKLCDPGQNHRRTLFDVLFPELVHHADASPKKTSSWPVEVTAKDTNKLIRTANSRLTIQ